MNGARLGAWLARFTRQAAWNWSAPPDSASEGPFLDSRLLAQIERLALQVGRSGTTGLAGEHPSRRQAQSVEFADYRDYRPGDDMRLIDWNVYARLGELTLRLTEASEATTLHLLLDASGSMAWGVPSKFRAMQRLAAALGCIALSRYDDVSISVLQGAGVVPLPRLRGRDATSRLLSILDDVHPAGPIDLGRAVADYCKTPRRGVGVLIGDLLTPEGLPDALARMRQAGMETLVLQVLAREEATPRLEGPLDLVDCETGQTLTTAITGEALRAYGARFAAWTVGLRETCLSQRAGFYRCYTNQSLDDVLLDLQGTGLVLR